MQSRSQEVKRYHPFPELFESTSYKYYDTPDGQDFIKKLFYTTKLGLKTGYIIGGFYAFAYWKKGTSRFWLLHDFVKAGAPFVIASAVYTITTFSLTELRKKDDVHNAQAGGFAAGAVIGTWFRKPSLALLFGVAGGLLCGIKKITVREDVAFPFTNYQRKAESPWALRHLDFSLTEDYPGNWTRIPRVHPKPPEEPPPLPPPPPPPSICDSFKI